MALNLLSVIVLYIKILQQMCSLVNTSVVNDAIKKMVILCIILKGYNG